VITVALSGRRRAGTGHPTPAGARAAQVAPRP
jgi:hypothetical protein